MASDSRTMLPASPWPVLRQHPYQMKSVQVMQRWILDIQHTAASSERLVPHKAGSSHAVALAARTARRHTDVHQQRRALSLACGACAPQSGGACCRLLYAEEDLVGWEAVHEDDLLP